MPESVIQEAEIAGVTVANEAAGVKLPVWPWRIGLVIKTGELIGEICEALADMGASWEFQISAGAAPYDIAGMVERQRPDVVFVELSEAAGPAADWINIIRSGGDFPLVIIVNANPDPAAMIVAMRAGASEFLSAPVKPAIFEAMDRMATQLEARQSVTAVPGTLVGVLSAKGGCGATTLACHLSLALQAASGGRVLMADLDQQSPAAHTLFRIKARAGVAEAFNGVRRLSSATWPEYVMPVAPQVDVLAGTLGGSAPEPWRIDNLLRFVRRNYPWILADLGRHLNPSNWAFLTNVQELLIVTAPDVLALYQTRSILQMLTNRGFDKSRVRLILNRNQNSPQDFWIESIQQMFDMSVEAVLPFDASTLGKASRERFEFPANSAYGRSVGKLAARLLKLGGTDDAGPAKKAA